jgi:amidase
MTVALGHTLGAQDPAYRSSLALFPSMRDYTDADATELARRLRDGEQSPAEVVDLAIAAIEQVEPRLHAVVHRMFDEARAAARGPLPDGPFRGVPMVVKDSDGFLGGQPYTARS